MDINDLVLCPICGGIPESERREFLGGLGIKVRRYAKGETVARQGSVGTRMMLGDGTTMGVTTIKAPNPLAPAFLFATDNHFPVDVTALEDCEVV